jgi:hypothetical protein
MSRRLFLVLPARSFWAKVRRGRAAESGPPALVASMAIGHTHSGVELLEILPRLASPVRSVPGTR